MGNPIDLILKFFEIKQRRRDLIFTDEQGVGAEDGEGRVGGRGNAHVAGDIGGVRAVKALVARGENAVSEHEPGKGQHDRCNKRQKSSAGADYVSKDY